MLPRLVSLFGLVVLIAPAPERRNDLARIGPRAMIAGLISCYVFSAIVGVIL